MLSTRLRADSDADRDRMEDLMNHTGKDKPSKILVALAVVLTFVATLAFFWTDALG